MPYSKAVRQHQMNHEKRARTAVVMIATVFMAMAQVWVGFAVLSALFGV